MTAVRPAIASLRVLRRKEQHEQEPEDEGQEGAFEGVLDDAHEPETPAASAEELLAPDVAWLARRELLEGGVTTLSAEEDPPPKRSLAAYAKAAVDSDEAA